MYVYIYIYIYIYICIHISFFICRFLFISYSFPSRVSLRFFREPLLAFGGLGCFDAGCLEEHISRLRNPKSLTKKSK